MTFLTLLIVVVVVIFLTVRGPIYLQTHSETYTHGNNVVLQKRPESYQSNVKNVGVGNLLFDSSK
jgi:hypothetical protein